MEDFEGVKIEREMPHSIEAEEYVLGAMFMDMEFVRDASEVITGADFYSPKYGMVFDAAVDVFREGKPVELILVHEKLKQKNVPPEVSSLEYAPVFMERTKTSANARHYVDIVYEKAMLRRLIRANDTISNECYAGKEKLNDVLENAEKMIFDIVQKRNTGELTPISKVVIDTLGIIERASKNVGNVTGVPTGFNDLDYKTAGFQPSDLILIAARPSVGKTAFALNIALNASVHIGKSVAIFSLEMGKEQLMMRLLSMESKVNSHSLRTGELKDKDWSKLMEGADPIGTSRLVIDDTPGISVGELSSKCRKIKLDQGLDMVVIDYLQLMKGSGRSESRQQEVSEISRSLKALARELNVPVVALSQLNRKVEDRQDGKPKLSDLRESGAIEQDADVVMFIHRDNYQNIVGDAANKPSVAEIIIAKQRNGSTGTIELAWFPEYTQFKDLAKESNGELSNP